MTSLELLKEIEAWLSFNTEPSKEETTKLRKSIKEHITEQLRIHNPNITGSSLTCTCPAAKKETLLTLQCRKYEDTSGKVQS